MTIEPCSTFNFQLSVTRHLVPRKKAYQAKANGNDAFTHIVQACL
jgi:hypothetical protein